MSISTTQTGPNGEIVIERDGSPPLVFATQEQYTAWQREYLACTLSHHENICFTMHPPKPLVSGTKKHGRGRGKTNNP